MGGTPAHLNIRQELVPKKDLVTMVVRCKLTPPRQGGEEGKTYTTTTCTNSITLTVKNKMLGCQKKRFIWLQKIWQDLQDLPTSQQY